MALQLMLLVGFLSAPDGSDQAAVSPSLDLVGPFLVRVGNATALPGRARSRIERDEQGEVVRLYLDRLDLQAADYAALAHLPELCTLSLRGTGATSGDLASLQELTKLESLVLTETQIDDDVLPHLLALPALKTLCLLGVDVSSEAVSELKRLRPKLGLGYSPRRPAP
jgi:hypothetical protein